MIIYANKIQRVKIIVLSPILIIRYGIHMIFLLSCRKKKIILKELETELLNFKMIFFSQPRYRRINLLLGFLWAVHQNPFFRTLFYCRIGSSRSYICSLIKKDNSTLMMDCANMGNLIMHHPFATIINAEKIGNNLTIRNNTTIGNINDNDKLRPCIRDNVVIGANVTIIGKITIGNNVTIGAGALVNKDIPDNCIVVGNPFRIISKDGVTIKRKV